MQITTDELVAALALVNLRAGRDSGLAAVKHTVDSFTDALLLARGISPFSRCDIEPLIGLSRIGLIKAVREFQHRVEDTESLPDKLRPIQTIEQRDACASRGWR